MDMYKQFSDEELIKAVELMVSKDDLKIRDIAEMLLNAFDYSAAEITEQLSTGEYLSNAEPLMLNRTIGAISVA